MPMSDTALTLASVRDACRLARAGETNDLGVTFCPNSRTYSIPGRSDCASNINGVRDALVTRGVPGAFGNSDRGLKASRKAQKRASRKARKAQKRDR